jgi:hypothetical protein
MSKEPIGLGEIHQELTNVSKLMILSLVRAGIQQGDIADSLGIDGSAVSRMFPKGVLKKIARLAKNVGPSD